MNSRKPVRPTLELTALIDIVFLLLIFFAVSTTVVMQKRGIKLTLPAAESTQLEKRDLIVSIDDKQQIFLDGKAIAEQKIRYKVTRLIKKGPLQVSVQADQVTPYALLIRVLDEIRLGGCFDVVLDSRGKGDSAIN